MCLDGAIEEYIAQKEAYERKQAELKRALAAGGTKAKKEARGHCGGNWFTAVGLAALVAALAAWLQA